MPHNASSITWRGLQFIFPAKNLPKKLPHIGVSNISIKQSSQDT